MLASVACLAFMFFLSANSPWVNIALASGSQLNWIHATHHATGFIKISEFRQGFARP
jgi:hypothetical protein